MSAYIVNKEHIDAIVAVAVFGPSGVRPGIWRGREPYFCESRADTGTADMIGSALMAENVRSINSRYPDTIDKPEGTPGPIDQYWHGPYTFPFVEDWQCSYRPTVIEAFGILRCYEYQACEHEEWDTSPVCRFIQRLRASLICCLPGMEDAPWSWDRQLNVRPPEKVRN